MSVPPDKMAPSAPATPTKEEKLEKILKDFEAGDTKTDHPGKNLRELLDKSPDLKARILDSVDKGHLEKFALLPAGANAGGSYNSGNKTIELPAGYLKTADKNKGDAAELVFVMGHEIQHSFNSTVSDKAVDGFLKEVAKTAKGPGPHDHTKAVKDFIQNFREDEAGAHIGGFNAVSSQVLKDNPKAGLKELYNAHPARMDDFIERSGKAPKFTYALKPGLTIEADMTIKATPENVKAMGKHYFDQPPSAARIGAKGNQDYPNYYGEWAINRIDEIEKKALAEARKADPKAVAPEVKLDLKDIGLNKSLLDTGLKYTDSSPKKPITAAEQDPYGGGIPFLRPEDVEAAMKKYGLQPLGIKTPQELDNVAAALTLKSQKDGLTGVDAVMRGNNGHVIAYQGDPASESVKRASVDIEQAKLQPADKSLAEMTAPPTVQRDAPQPVRGPAL